MGMSLHRGLFGNLEGIHLLGLLRGEDSISGFLSWTQRTFKILSLGAIWNFGKGTGLFYADIRLWGTKGPSIRPRCIWTIRARTQCKSINLTRVNYLIFHVSHWVCTKPHTVYISNRCHRQTGREQIPYFYSPKCCKARNQQQLYNQSFSTSKIF